MFPSFIGILDIQSWWEVPSIAYFCSLFRTAFNLLDFDIEELEEALLTDGTEDSASSLLTELIVRLLNGCLGNNDISAFNYQMYLRRLFRRKCQETGRDNPFDNDIDFQFLPLRTKVEILYALCDFRLDADDVFDLFKNLEAESLRVEPLGWDDNHSAYWYFYGTRLYREDIIKKEKPKGKNKKKKAKETTTNSNSNCRREWFAGDDWQDDEDTERVWQVVCFTEEDWGHLTQKFKEATSKEEKELYRSLSQNFLPEIPRLFQERERLQRKRLLELAPRRTSSRVLQKIKQKEEEGKQSAGEDKVEPPKDTPELAREIRARRRNLLRRKTPLSDSSSGSESENKEMPQKEKDKAPPSKRRGMKPRSSTASKSDQTPAKDHPEAPVKSGRKTNNSLASATGQILIPDNDDQASSTRKKLKTSQIFTRTEEDIQTDMYKVLEQLTAHEDAWPFMDPVEEEYAPNYYAVIRRPMDLRKMEARLDSGYYTDFATFKTDFKLIVNNCRLYNGQDNEYTTMVDNLQAAFDRLTEKYMNRLSSSDEEIAVEYQLPTPPRKHKLKPSESPVRHKRKKRKFNSDGERSRSTSRTAKDEDLDEKPASSKDKKPKESRKGKTEKGKKKRKGHHRHGKHSKRDKTKQDKGKHGKKGRHGKDKTGKKSKRKKSKHQEVVTEEVTLKRSESQESLESSYRSRSASPLPSIHTPTPSPEPALEPAPETATETVSEPAPEPDSFYKNKFDKIKERRRHAASTSAAPDAWDSLFDYKNKSTDKQKQNLHLPKKDKHQKLRETIEKLKAKNEKYKDTFNALLKGNRGKKTKTSESSSSKQTNDIDDDDDPDFTDDDDEEDSQKSKPTRKGTKKPTAKNESTTEALEQAVKDISKWLDDAPKGSVASSPNDSPAQTISTEEHENSRLDDEFPVADKAPTKKETSRKRPSSREPKTVKRREIQRTIDRLQPGKSKGNLLTNSKNTEKTEEVAPAGPITKTRETAKAEEPITQSPKLSLGSVLPTVEFTLGSDHNFDNEEKVSAPPEVVKESQPDVEKQPVEKPDAIKKVEDEDKVCTKKDAEVETEVMTMTKPSQEKATPNLSAWFKAFGAPKTPAPASTVKKKGDDAENDEKANETTTNESKVASPKTATKYDSPTDPGTPAADGGDSPLTNVAATPRQRRTSTGSSVSERSSFSQDLDSPRHQMSHTSPLLRSPASPRDDFQKISYPIINGTVRAGFYQDTTSMKSSPEKSCSPREAPQSPFSPYSAHVYASNSAMGSATPNYFVDHNKSPRPTYGQNPPSYYDTAKAGNVGANKPRANDEYTSLAPTTYQQTPYGGSYSPADSPYGQSQLANYAPSATQSPQPTIVESSPPVDNASVATDSKPSPYPVKKRSYIEPEAILTPRKSIESKEPVSVIQNQNDYHRISQQPSQTPSVDDIALVLSEKSEIAKLNSLQEKSNEFERDKTTFENNGRHNEPKKDFVNENKAHESVIKDNVDMVNMGYMNPDYDRRNNTQERAETHEYPRDAHKVNATNQPKGYEVDAIAMNLGMSNQPLQKHMSKPNMNSGNIPPAHSGERLHCEFMSQNMTQAHHPYDALSSGQSISNFSLNDIELANKKLYGCNTTVSAAPAIDYGNWKMTNQIRKQETLPSDYSMAYSTSAEKLRASINSTNASAINYNKNIQQQQYNNYNVPRAMHRAPDVQHNTSSELRIPNPRGHLKNDNSSSSMSDNQTIAKSMDNLAKNQKSEKHSQPHSAPLSSPISYKAPYSSHSSLPLDSLRIPQMMERYANDERYLSSFAGGGSSLYHDKSFEMAQMFNKSLAAEVHATSASASIYSQSSMTMSKDSNMYKGSTSVTSTPDTKAKSKRKRTSDAKQMQMSASQSYHSSPSDVLSSVKSSMLPGSAFNFGSSANMGLGGGLYGDNGGFSIEEFRSSTANQLMAANYMAAAVAHQQRSTAAAEAGQDKLGKGAHQTAGGGFPFMGHGAGRGAYPFDAGSPLYQQYLQRHQEELLRQTAMGLYPPAYPPIRQPYDSINRPSWL